MKRQTMAIAASLVALSLGGCVATTAPGQQAQSFASPEEARLVTLARDIESRGDSGTALALYERAAELVPESPAAQARLGEARIKAGDAEGAGIAFKAALQRDPNYPPALIGVGTLELNAGETDQAVRHLSAAAPLVKTATAYNRLGTALVLTGRPAEAKTAYTQARQLDPQNVDIAGNVALAAALAGEHEAAITMMRAIVATPRAKPRHQRNLIVVLALAGRDDEAAAVIAPEMTAKQKTDLLARAKKLKVIADPVARAKAVGLMANG